MRRGPSRLVCLTLAASLLLTGRGGPPTLADGSEEPTTGAGTPSLAAKAERLFRALEAAARELPRETFDPKAVVTQVGRGDPAKLFEWVRDRTWWAP